MAAKELTRPILAVFDFDGTLTFRDSFTLFLRRELGFGVYIAGMARLLVPAAAFLFGLKTRDELKADLVRGFLTGWPAVFLDQLADRFCERYWDVLMRPNGLQAVNDQLLAGATVTICSASPEFLLRPFSKRLGVALIATQLEESQGVLTGSIRIRNCRQQEKVSRLECVYGDLSKFHLRAWGDSEGDRQLLEVADEPFYRKFN